MVKIEEFFKQNGAIIEVAKAVVKPYVCLLSIMDAVKTLRGWISTDFYCWESVSTEYYKHFLVNSGTIVPLLHLATMSAEIIGIVWLTDRLTAMHFEPIKVHTPFLCAPLVRLSFV